MIFINIVHLSLHIRCHRIRQPRIRTATVFVNWSYIDIPVFHLSCRRNTGMCYFRDEHTLVVLKPVRIWRTHNRLPLECMVCRIRKTKLL